MYFFIKQFWEIQNWVRISSINRVLDFFLDTGRTLYKQGKQTIKFDPKTTQFKSNKM